MSVVELIKEFSGREKVPVDVNDVVEILRQRGIKDEVYFWAADLDGEKLRGQLVQTVHWDHTCVFYTTKSSASVEPTGRHGSE